MKLFSQVITFLFVFCAIQVAALPTPDANKRDGKLLKPGQYRNQRSKKTYLTSSTLLDVLPDTGEITGNNFDRMSLLVTTQTLCLHADTGFTSR